MTGELGLTTKLTCHSPQSSELAPRVKNRCFAEAPKSHSPPGDLASVHQIARQQRLMEPPEAFRKWVYFGDIARCRQ